jgi:hypothetical protein
MAFYYPTGIILPFDVACPSGWTQVTDLTGYFIKGGITYGTTVDSTTHKHKIDFGTILSGTATGSGVDAESGTNAQDTIEQPHRHTFVTYVTYSGGAETIPSYVNVVFCMKN